MKLAIFGAQGYALGAYEAIKNIYPERKILFFVVTSISGNPTMLSDLPVREIEEVSNEMSQEKKDSLEILIATPENVQSEIEVTLEKYGFHNHRRLDYFYWNGLMSEYHAKQGDFIPLSDLPIGHNKTSLEIYMAKFHKDKELTTAPVINDYIVPIQVGAANTDERITTVVDNIGDNISRKNVNYCELTGLYWVWKNILCSIDTPETEAKKYFGMAQYRRMFILSDDDLYRLVGNDVDVVLPYPLAYEPNIHAHHERYLKDSDWQALLRAIEEIHPDYADAFSRILAQRYLYNYNVILAKKGVLRDYCEWLFPVLERTEELSYPKGTDRADRYIGYMGETLETLYFMKNKDKLNIVHTGCKLFV